MGDHRKHLSRRLFTAHAAACVAGSGVVARPGRAQPTSRRRPPVSIKAITLETSQPLATMKAFYGTSIGLPVVDETDSTITFRSGRSTVTFMHRPESKAFYHFAFNIPENQIESAHAWQRERSELITPPERLNDPGLPREVVAFRSWNAHSVFFWDPAGSAVEYIARHDLANARAGAFSTDSILRLSEIAFITNDVPDTAGLIRQALDVPNYSSRSSEFEALGDPHGLLLVFKQGRPMAFGQGGSRDVYPTEVRLAPDSRGRRPESFEIMDHPYLIHNQQS